MKKIRLVTYEISEIGSQDKKICSTESRIYEKLHTNKEYGFIPGSFLNSQNLLEGNLITQCPSFNPPENPLNYCRNTAGAYVDRSYPDGWIYENLSLKTKPEITIVNQLKQPGTEYTYFYTFEDCGLNEPELRLKVVFDQIECFTADKCKAKFEECCPEIKNLYPSESFGMTSSKKFIFGSVTHSRNFIHYFEFEIIGSAMYDRSADNEKIDESITAEDLEILISSAAVGGTSTISKRKKVRKNSPAWILTTEIKCKLTKVHKGQNYWGGSLDASNTNIPNGLCTNCASSYNFNVPDPFNSVNENKLKEQLEGDEIFLQYPDIGVRDGIHQGKKLQLVGMLSQIGGLAADFNTYIESEAGKISKQIKESYANDVVPNGGEFFRRKLQTTANSNIIMTAQVEDYVDPDFFVSQDPDFPDNCLKCSISFGLDNPGFSSQSITYQGSS